MGATESLLACHLLLSTGSPLNAPYSFCDKDLRIEVCYIIHFILAAFTGKAGFPPLSQSFFNSRDGWRREWHIIYVSVT